VYGGRKLAKMLPANSHSEHNYAEHQFAMDCLDLSETDTDQEKEGD
jgi:hypothetical protein